MIRALVLVAWRERAVHAATFGVLFTGAIVTAALALLAAALTEGTGDVSSLVSVGVIAMLYTVVVLRAVSRHAVEERWPTSRRLRIVGLGARTLVLVRLTEAAAIATVASVLAIVAARSAAVPLLLPWLARLEIVPADIAPGMSPVALLSTVGVVVAASVLGTCGAARTLARAEPSATEPPRGRTATRGARSALVVVSLAAGLSAVGAAITATSDLVAYVWCLVALVPAVVAISSGWTFVVLRVARARRLMPFRVGPAALVSTAWRTRRHPSTVVLATAVATLVAVFMGGYPAANDAVARTRLAELLEGLDVAEPTDGSALTEAQVTELLGRSPGVVLADATAVVVTARASVPDGSMSRPITLVGGEGAAGWLAGLAPIAAPVEGGVVVPAVEAGRSGLATGDPVWFADENRPTPAVEHEVAAVADMPGALGEYLLMDRSGELSGSSTGSARILLPAGAPAPRGWSTTSGDRWVRELPAGAATSNSGGAGTEETPLLVGAPLALCLALAVAATASTTLGRSDDLRALRATGASRGHLVQLVVRHTLADTWGVGAVAGATGVGLVGVALRPVVSETAVGTALPPEAYGFVWVPLAMGCACLVTALAAGWRLSRGAL
ncbi:hypothetical protein [Cellulomonas sp. Marseille-Q8402]